MGVLIPVEWRDLCEEVFADRLGLAGQYAQLLAGEGIEWGLIGPRETERLWERHIVNSLCVVPLVGAGVRVADLGSGAGLPGIPLALARPDVRVDLVEPMQRRVQFLQLCVERLGLGDQVRVVRARGQEYAQMLTSSKPRRPAHQPGHTSDPSHQGTPMVLTCRALTSVAGLVTMVETLVPPAVLLAIKGGRAQLEVDQASAKLAGHDLAADIVQPEVAGQVVGTVVRIGRRG